LRTENKNAAMAQLLDRVRRVHLTRIDPELDSYLSDGLAVQADGSVVSVAASKGAHADRSQFADRVDYEAFVNKIHLDDWSGDALAEATIEEKLAHTLLLADRVEAWAERKGVSVAVVISVDLAARDVVFRFHGIRPDEALWLGDVHRYDEPVFIRLYQFGE
jgi:hypothetical protein